MNQSQPNKYLESAVQTASPEKLLIMLCDGAIRFCKMGIEKINQQQFIDAHMNICKAQDIISEFIITLDHSAPVAEGLLKMYDYFNFRLIQANTKKEIEPIEEVIQFLAELKETWIQAALMTSKARPAGIANEQRA
jgi:flagellar protein FliS